MLHPTPCRVTAGGRGNTLFNITYVLRFTAGNNIRICCPCRVQVYVRGVFYLCPLYTPVPINLKYYVKFIRRQTCHMVYALLGTAPFV